MNAVEPTFVDSKKKIRQDFLKRRQSLGFGEVQFRTERILKNFFSHKDEMFSSTPSSIGLYYPIRGEVDTRIFFQEFRKLKQTQKKLQFFFPKIEAKPEKRLSYYPADSFSELITGSYGIAEPSLFRLDTGESFLSEEAFPQIIFVPMVAFDLNCFRLGYGAGYFDRTLAYWSKIQKREEILLVGLAYDFQATIFPVDSYDSALDFVVTESSFYRGVK